MTLGQCARFGFLSFMLEFGEGSPEDGAEAPKRRDNRVDDRTFLFHQRIFLNNKCHLPDDMVSPPTKLKHDFHPLKPQIFRTYQVGHSFSVRTSSFNMLPAV